MSSTLTWLTVVLVIGFAFQAGSRVPPAAPKTSEERAAAFIAEYEAKIRPLEIAVSRAWWKANTTGDDADFAAKEKAQNELDQQLSNADRFAELKLVKEAKLSDKLVARQIEVLYL